jgi:hypothetical protein
MPGQRRTAGPRARGSRLPRLAGLAIATVIAAGAVTGYLLVQRPARAHVDPPLPRRVESYQTVGLIAQDARAGNQRGQLLQLLGTGQTAEFRVLEPAEAAQGSPQWTADLMKGGTYIFIFLPSGDCLTASGSGSGVARLSLQHCDLAASQRWRRSTAAALIRGHEFYQYANLADRSCLTEDGQQAGQDYGAGLSACAAVPASAADQLIAFWWSSV